MTLWQSFDSRYTFGSSGGKHRLIQRPTRIIWDTRVYYERLPTIASHIPFLKRGRKYHLINLIIACLIYQLTSRGGTKSAPPINHTPSFPTAAISFFKKWFCRQESSIIMYFLLEILSQSSKNVTGELFIFSGATIYTSWESRQSLNFWHFWYGPSK